MRTAPSVSSMWSTVSWEIAADIAALPLPTNHVIDAVGFLDADQVDPLMYSRPYCLAAQGPISQRPYALLTEALACSGRLAVCKVPIRSIL
ncbi:hypothetical protein FCH28_03615 [Streptomyces piniterrae]|uniref:Ku domain-containing protein n=1 Tax=Streptomyces piniterrae TaxID=2571125 RepID=A0A4U0NWN9_9ACTN|nr:Ku protein [Streptomyces piniterrae]TJZ59191.1 hypothetical protein FCH28_03615 [Streptomyces piniterrae]